MQGAIGVYGVPDTESTDHGAEYGELGTQSTDHGAEHTEGDHGAES